MIDLELAEKFIKRAAQYTQYNINVMNEDGIIIASSDGSRVGTFHELAYKIMNGENDLLEVRAEDNFQGGRSGINMALKNRGRKIGVVGITCDPDKSRDTANIVRMALETIIEYESQKQQMYQRQNLHTRLFDALLYDENANREGELSAVSKQLGLDPQKMRIMVLMITHNRPDTDWIMEHLKKSSIFHRQDILGVSRNNNIVAGICFEDAAHLLCDYRILLKEKLEKVDACLKKLDATCMYYVGSFQNQYTNYKQSFEHARWLYHTFGSDQQRIHYFYDYVGDYIRNTVSMYELTRIYAPICDELKSDVKSSTIELISALDDCNYSLKEASEKLFIHKNTLVFRFNKLKDLFHINPLKNSSDREFLNWMNLYLTKNR